MQLVSLDPDLNKAETRKRLLNVDGGGGGGGGVHGYAANFPGPTRWECKVD